MTYRNKIFLRANRADWSGTGRTWPATPGLSRTLASLTSLHLASLFVLATVPDVLFPSVTRQHPPASQPAAQLFPLVLGSNSS